MGVLPTEEEAASTEGAGIPSNLQQGDMEGGGREGTFLGFRFQGCGGERWKREMMKMGRGYSGMVGGPGQDRNDLCAPPYPSPSLNHRNVTERSLGTKRRANAPRTPSHGPQAAPRGGSTFPHFTSTATKAQRGRLTTRGHTGIGPTQRVEYYSRPGGFTPLGAPPSGRSRPEPLLLPAPEGRPGGRAEEVSAAGRNVSGRGTPARGGGDSQAGGRGGGRPGRRARRGRARRMPHFTVVPVDGPRRGDYDNLEGISWVDYGERADREDSEGEDAPGGVLGGGGGGGREAGHAGPALTPTPAGARTRRCGPNFS